jgi:hypothetical protein
MRHTKSNLVAGAVALFAAVVSSAFAQTAAAQGQPKAVAGEVLIILAKEAPGEIDRDLKDVAALKQEPFSRFKSMKLLSRPVIAVEAKKPVEVKLPNGRTLQVEIAGVMSDGRLRVKVSINKPDKKDYLPLVQVLATAGEPFFCAGQNHDGGTLVLGVRLGDKVVTTK